MATDVKKKILLEFKADTKQAQKNVGALGKVQARVSKMGVEGMAKLAIGVAAVGAAYRAIGASVDFFLERTQQAFASSEADIGRIQAAARGLITEQEALTFAAAALNTEFKLSQQQMEDVAKFMIVLRNQGNDLREVQDKLTKAIVQGNSRALINFGVIVDGTTGKLETQTAIFEEIRKQNLAFGDELLITGDSFQQMAVAGQNAMDNLKASVGEAMILIADSINRTVRDGAADILLLSGAQGAAEVAIERALARRLRSFSPEQRKFLKRFREFSEKFTTEDLGTIGALDLNRRGRGGGGGGGVDIGQAIIEGGEVGRFAGNRGQFRGTGQFGPGRQGGGGISVLDVETEDRQNQAFNRLVENLRSVRSEAQLLADSMMIVGLAITSSFEQWGAGAISLGEALKSALGNAIGDILLGEAKKHLALAVADAITLNFGGAGLHVAAAASLATASGAVRNFLGGSGGGSGAGGGGGRLPGAAAGGFGGSGGTSSETIILTGDPDTDDPRAARRRRQGQLDRMEAQRGQGTTITRA